jgi:hypothetical protein
MNVTIKKFDVSMELKNKGVELEIRSPDSQNHLGDLIVTKSKIIWCPGRTMRKNGKGVSFREFINWMENR